MGRRSGVALCRWLLGLTLAGTAGVVDGRTATQFGGVIDRASPVVQGEFFDDLMARGDLRWVRLAGDWLTERGIDQVAVVRFAPPSTRRGDAFRASRPEARVGSQSTTPLPDDLMALYWHCRTNLPVQRGVRQAWEIWNEPDFHFVADNPDRMTAVVKAAWWGVKAGNPAAQVLMPSLAFPPGAYLEELVRNRLGPYTDGYNFHHYGWAHEFLPHLRAHQDALARAGWRLPLWITEAGHAEMVARAAPGHSELARQQAYHERVAISAYAAGVDYYLPFILTPYLERNSDLGLANADFSPRPALDSYLYLTRALPPTRPLYWIWHRPTASEVGVVLGETSTTWWVVLWTPHRYHDLLLPASGVRGPDWRGKPGLGGPGAALHGATQLLNAPRRTGGDSFEAGPEGPWDGGLNRGGTDLALAFRFARAGVDLRVGLKGETRLGSVTETQFQVAAEANLHLRVPAARFEIEDCEWRSITPSSRWPWVAAGRTVAPHGGAHLVARRLQGAAPGKPSPVVLQVDYARGSFQPHKPSRTYRYEPGGPLRAEVTLYNFSEVRQSGVLSMALPSGWHGRLEPGDGAEVMESELVPELRPGGRIERGGSERRRSGSGREGERRKGLGFWEVPPLGRLTARLTLEPPQAAAVPRSWPAYGEPVAHDARFGVSGQRVGVDRGGGVGERNKERFGGDKRPAEGEGGSGAGSERSVARAPFELRWRGEGGVEDIHAVWLEPLGLGVSDGMGWPAVGWQNRPEHPDRWQIEPAGADTVRLTLRQFPPRGTSLSALYVFPQGWRFRADDTMQLSARVHSAATNVMYRVFLFTDDRQVLRYQDHEWFREGAAVWEARVGDLARSLWSRIPSARSPDPARIRFLSLEVTALQPGDWVEVKGSGGPGSEEVPRAKSPSASRGPRAARVHVRGSGGR